jgi:1-acyl-sn-glycerol-3-phosphate acyltransferase
VSHEVTLADENVDCELRDRWFLGQDVNAWSSLAYVGVAVVIAVVVVRRRLPRAFLALAVVVALEGAGSLAYHGGRGDAAQFLHDTPLVAALGFVAGWHVGRVSGRASTSSLVGLAAGAVAGTTTWALDASPNPVVAVLVAVVVGAEVLAWRRGKRRIWTVPLLALGVVAAATWAAGTAGSPLCDEQSWLQPHGLWHVLSAVVVLAWVDQALTAADPLRAPRLARRAVDRILGLLAAVLALAFFRSIEVTGRERLRVDAPVLLVANHGNGFVDPIIVTAVLGRLPRFLAKAALWKVPVARPFLALAGVLPVHRRADGDRAGANRKIFEACHRELASGATVAIFPEGTTGDRAGLDRVKSGAARIALGSVPGAPDLVIVPVGLAFESRIETRGRTLAMIGEPIAAATHAHHPLVDADEPDRDDVQGLTDEITTALEAVSPEFASVEEREILRAAARVRRNTGAGRNETKFGAVEVLARRLAAQDAERRAEVIDAYGRYATQLQLIGLTDHQLQPAPMPIIRLLGSAIALVALGSVVATATLIHLPAIVVVLAATAAVRSTATKGTVRLLVGLTAGLLTWIVAGMILGDGWGAVAAGALVAAEGALALAVWPPMTRLASALWGRIQVRDRVGLLPPVLAARADVVAAVDRALAASTAPAAGTVETRVATD